MRIISLITLLAVALPLQAVADVYIKRLPDGRVIYTDVPTTPDHELIIRESPEVHTWRTYANILAERYGLDPKLVRAVIYVESNENPSAVSHKGAQGLMQLMPETARDLGVEDPMRPRDNVRGGVAYLAKMLDRYGGNVRLALAAYNAGPGAVDKYGGIPPYPETQRYVKKVLDVFSKVELGEDNS